MRTRFLDLVRRRRIVLSACWYGLLAVVSGLAAFLIRFDLTLPLEEVQRGAAWLGALALARVITADRFGVFRGSWRHVSTRDAVRLAQATLVGSVAAMALAFGLGRLAGLPRSVLLLEPMLYFGLAASSRLAVRMLTERSARPVKAASRRVLVIGDGAEAERFARSCLGDPAAAMRPVGMVAVGEHPGGVEVHGIPVLGGLSDLPALVARSAPDLLAIALATATGEEMRRVVSACERSGLPIKVIPTLRELMDGRRPAGDLRNLRIEDLLGRRPVRLALDDVAHDLAGATVMVTGAAGSIGSELARQVARFGPRTLVLFEQAESPLYLLQVELARTFPTLPVVAVIGDIVDAARVQEACARHRPDVVFHAAAYKHVPMMEAHPGEAVRNNVLGTLQVAEAAGRHGARKFVLISTDKAVYPASVMGATKRVAELLGLGHPTLRRFSGMDFRAVRFGNVLGSAGSVVPLFQRQLADGGPLTVTHPDVKRYFMTIPEAVELVLQAAALPEARDRISMLDMGEPVRIVELAEQLIRLDGREPYRDVPIVFTGLRDGEKLEEDLMSLLEEGVPTRVEQVRMLRTDGLAGAPLEQGVRRLLAAADADDGLAVLRALHALIPEYTPRLPDLERPLERAVDVPLERAVDLPVERGADAPARLRDALPSLGRERRSVARVGAVADLADSRLPGHDRRPGLWT